MTHEPVRTLRVTPCPSRIAIVRDLLIILVCAAILLGTFADVFLPGREAPQSAAPAATRISFMAGDLRATAAARATARPARPAR